MRQTEAFAVLYFFAEFLVPFIHIEESIQITGIGVLILIADIAGFFFLLDPHADSVATLRSFAELVLETGFAGMERSKLTLHFTEHFDIVSLQDPGIAQGISVVEHFLEMHAAEACFVSHFANVGFHVRGTGT